MSKGSPLTVAVAGGLGAMLARLITGPWPADAGDWIGTLLLGVAVAAGAWLLLRYVLKHR